MKFLLQLLCPAVFGSFLRLQLGGGGGSTQANTSTSNADKRNSVNSGIGVSGDGNSLNVLDGGAIKNAFDFSGSTVAQALGFAGASQQETLGFALKSNAQALDSLNVTTDLVKNAYADAKGRGAMTDYLLMGAMALAGLVAVYALRK